MNPVLNSQCRTVASSPPAFGEAPGITCCVFSVCHQAQSWKILCISMLNFIQWYINMYFIYLYIIFFWCLAHLGSLHFYTILVARNWSDMTFITLIWQIHDAEKNMIYWFDHGFSPFGLHHTLPFLSRRHRQIHSLSRRQLSDPCIVPWVWWSSWVWLNVWRFREQWGEILTIIDDNWW